MSPEPKRQTFTPSTAELRVLQAVAAYPHSSNVQICRLLFSPRSLARAKKLLKWLQDAGYIQGLYLDRNSNYGRPMMVYALARRGVSYLRSLGAATPDRVRPSEEAERSKIQLRHRMEI